MDAVPAGRSAGRVRWGALAGFAALALAIGAVAGGLLGGAAARQELEPRISALDAEVDETTSALSAAEARTADAETAAAQTAEERDALAASLTETVTQRDLALSERDAAIAEANRMAGLYEQTYDAGLAMQTQRNQLAGQISTLNQNHTALGTVYEQLVAAANAQDAKRVAEYNALVDQANSNQADLKSLLGMCHADMRTLLVAVAALDVAQNAALEGDADSYLAAMDVVDLARATYKNACNPQ